jgi:uncharacterized membrane protein YfcA
MSIVPALGSLSLGVVVGLLVRYFIRRFKTFGPAALGSVISIIVGGAVIKFLEADTTVFWFYPIGLLAGFLIYFALAIWESKQPERPGGLTISPPKTDTDDRGKGGGGGGGGGSGGGGGGGSAITGAILAPRRDD